MNQTGLDLGPAHRDLLCVLRTAVAGAAPESCPADWAAVLDLAKLHQVDLFLYPIVRAWDSSFQPPEDLMVKWRSSFLRAVAVYTRISAQAAEILTALRAEQIRVIPLKGVWLAEAVYEDGACRPMNDIDLLVPPEDLDRARNVFERLGYASIDHFLSVERDKHIRYKRPDTVLPIELHWRLWHPGMPGSLGQPDSPLMWAALHEEQLYGVPVSVFSIERQLVYLSKHILSHALAVPLKAYLDLVLLCRRYAPQLDPVQLDAEAVAWKVPFGSKFIVQVAMDILGGVPSTGASLFLAEGEYAEERSEALHTALQLNRESCQLTPAMVACRQASWFKRCRLGVSRVFIPPEMIRLSYSSAMCRFGLVGGYISRCIDLFRRRSRAWKNVARNDPVLAADLANFSSREAMEAWIQKQDRQNNHRSTIR